MSPPRPSGAPQLLTVAATAELLNVTPRTVLNWIREDRIPYVELPGNKPTYRIPQHALLATLRGNYNLGEELEQIHAREGVAGAGDPVELGVDPEPVRSRLPSVASRHR